MSISDFWALHTKLCLLSQRHESDRRLLWMRLSEIKSNSVKSLTHNRPRRLYPKVARNGGDTAFRRKLGFFIAPNPTKRSSPEENRSSSALA